MQKLRLLAGVTVFTMITTLFMNSTPTYADAEDKSMLYLVKFEATQAGAPTAREQAIDLLEKLIVPTLEHLAKEGKIRAGGIYVGARAGIFIVSASSQEVTRLVRALPAWGVWQWKVKPLESFDHRADLEKKMVQKLRAEKR